MDAMYVPMIFPFLWMHGEDEQTIREYIRKIHESNLEAFCVESRPHPDFVGPAWWRDMDIVLDEAKKLGMQVWILDDSHFPTGYAAGAMREAPAELCRQSLTYQVLDCPSSGEWMDIPLETYKHAAPFQPSLVEQYAVNWESVRSFDDDRLIGLVAVKMNGDMTSGILNLCDAIGQERLRFQVPEGHWKLYILHLTRNRGPHRDYINMLSAASCRKLIDAVYEPHWAHYQKEFGKTIAGFFSDEPELGNGHLYEFGKPIWQLEDQAWSDEVTECMREALGKDWEKYLPLLWAQDFDAAACAKVRLSYMDAVTRLVQKDFSEQIGTWCQNHGVRYIGHLIEDNNQHSRTGSSLGHYFRGLAGQDMAGIDDIGGQVLPQAEYNGPFGLMGDPRNGRFYHYVLGRLGASLAVIDPRKHGDCMCEIFGNYGWEEGVRLEKYLADHFLVRGINHFVPHAFSMKAYPDPDCPPHFYAHGNHPQFRHFGALMAYMNRMCALLKSGTLQAQVAILNGAESDWMGRCMPPEEMAEPLARSQISYDFLPADVFTDQERYRTDLSCGLSVNGRDYRALILPACDFLPPSVKNALPALREKGVMILDAGAVSPLMIPQKLQALALEDAKLAPACGDIRTLHGKGDTEYWFFVKEGKEPWQGVIDLPNAAPCLQYDAWQNGWQPVEAEKKENGMRLRLTLLPLHSTVILLGSDAMDLPRLPEEFEGRKKRMNQGWRRSVCPAILYPRFTDEKEVSLPDDLAEEMPAFSGFVRYEKEINLDKVPVQAELTVTDAYEGVEVFINGQSMGLQIVPPFRYHVAHALRPGKNSIVIEVATTLERENAEQPDPMRMYLGVSPKTPACPSGINGQVIWKETEE